VSTPCSPGRPRRLPASQGRRNVAVQPGVVGICPGMTAGVGASRRRVWPASSPVAQLAGPHRIPDRLAHRDHALNPRSSHAPRQANLVGPATQTTQKGDRQSGHPSCDAASSAASSGAEFRRLMVDSAAIDAGRTDIQIDVATPIHDWTSRRTNVARPVHPHPHQIVKQTEDWQPMNSLNPGASVLSQEITSFHDR
jgi:hypothetical protein